MSISGGDVNPVGFTVVKDNENPEVDIIFVHGLGGHPHGTWACEQKHATSSQARGIKRLARGFRGIFSRGRTIPPPLPTAPEPPQQHSNKDEFFWPRDLLGLESWSRPTRILTYGYNSKVTKGYSATDKSNLFAHGKDFLYALQREKPPRRNVIFVAHSLGGLVLKEALRRSEASEEYELKDIVRSTIGIIFIGTPHRGSSDLVGLADNVRRLASLTLRIDNNPTLLRALGTDSPELELGRESFLVLWRTYNFRVKTFQEAQGISGVNIGPLNEKVVPDMSSSLDDPREHAETIHENHRNMCRFRSEMDPGYRKVSGEIKAMMAIAHKEPPQSSCDGQGKHGQSAFDETPELAHAQNSELLRSLYFPEMNDRRKNIKRALDGTCDWLFSAPEFKTWQDRVDVNIHHGFLWIKGKPGAGKSTLMKEAVTRAENEAKKEGSAGRGITASFFFNARGTQHLEKTPLGVYRSLLHQVLNEDKLALAYVWDIYSKMKSNQGSVIWHEEDLQKCLVRVFERPKSRPSTLFIDAMDECDEDDVRALLRFFKGLAKTAHRAGARLRVCFSSRHYPNVSIEGCPELIVEHHSRADILLYIESESEDNSTVRELKGDIFAKSNGVFLWVVLVVAMLQSKGRGRSLKWLKQKLAEIPPQLDALFRELFETMDPEDRERTIRLMQIMLFSETRSSEEIHTALAFSGRAYASIADWEGSVEFLETLKQAHEMIIELSRGLLEPTVAISESRQQNHFDQSDLASTTYQFIHETVREFFLNGDGFRLLGLSSVNISGSGHRTLATACVNYLNTSECATPAPGEVLSPYYLQDTFWEYVTESTFDHIEAAERAGESQEDLLKLIQTNNLVERLIYHQDGLRSERLSHQDGLTPSERLYYQDDLRLPISPGADLLFAAVELGLFHTVSRLLTMGFDPNKPCAAEMKYPLLVAIDHSRYGNDGIAELLLTYGASVSSRGAYEQTALHLAAGRSIDLVRKLLPYGPDINARDIYGRTALHEAIFDRRNRDDCGEMVKLLIKHGADVNAAEQNGDTPLHQAVRWDLESKIRELYAADQDDYRYTPLHQGLRWDIDIKSAIRELLSGGVDVNAANKYGNMPLRRVVRWSNESAIRELLSGGADVNAANKAGNTPLHQAAGRGHESAICELLNGGADRFRTNTDGKIPYDLAYDLVSDATPPSPEEVQNVKLLLATEGSEVTIAMARSQFFYLHLTPCTDTAFPC
ncbi:hypothetical protein QBC46DRAFT_388104 [Diplogelasinospora grovesii]|uniref:Nephrocystin 3-like N-terminal domain-containing protein n=1 Tax=Diplogelasinospora grovesii TaxID=303347 RepID=A0AAN6N6E9_9PEZI|nr:hypothetical protein QBC46DRAFT_388104 [Diplogelasinospora grovesii]